MRKVLLDTDIGSDVDDALALLIALRSPEISLEGVTTVYGKTDLRAKIAEKMIDYSGKNVPVYVGEATLLNGAKHCWHTGLEGEGILSASDFERDYREIGINPGGVDFLVDKIMAGSDDMYLCTIGPLTNIARALRKEPRIAQKVKMCYTMAGAIAFPQRLNLDNIARAQKSEHNIACDIQAAQTVFNSNLPITLFPLDVTSKTAINRKDFDCLNGGNELNRAVYNLVGKWFSYKDALLEKKSKYTYMHDPLTLAAILRPGMIKTTKLNLHVNDMGILDVDDGRDINVCYDFNADEFRKLFFERITGQQK